MNAWPQNKLKEIVDNEAAPLNYLITAFEDHLLKVFAELDKARAAKARADAYPVNAQAALCPNCWKKGVDAELIEICKDARVDVYRCGGCRLEFSVPFV